MALRIEPLAPKAPPARVYKCCGCVDVGDIILLDALDMYAEMEKRTSELCCNFALFGVVLMAFILVNFNFYFKIKLFT